MSLTVDSRSTPAPHLSRSAHVRLVPAAPALWRVVDRDSRVIGHLQAIRRGRDTRYVARRFHSPSRAFRELGEFWSAGDAIECITFAR